MSLILSNFLSFLLYVYFIFLLSNTCNVNVLCCRCGEIYMKMSIILRLSMNF